MKRILVSALLVLMGCFPLSAHATHEIHFSDCTATGQVFVWDESGYGECVSSWTTNIPLATGYYMIGGADGNATSIDPEVIITEDTTLTANQVRFNIVSNYGQGAANVTATFPTAAQGMGCLIQIGTAQAGNYWRVRAGTNDKIYLNGVAGADNGYVSNAAPAVGESMSCWTFQTGASAWDWKCVTADDWAVP